MKQLAVNTFQRSYIPVSILSEVWRDLIQSSGLSRGVSSLTQAEWRARRPHSHLMPDLHKSCMNSATVEEERESREVRETGLIGLDRSMDA